MCLRPCLHTEQHRWWFSYSISASNSITECNTDQDRSSSSIFTLQNGSFAERSFMRYDYETTPVKLLALCSQVLPFSMKSMTVKEFKLLQFLPSWLDVCRLDESSEPSFSNSEPSPSFTFFDLLLFFFEDILIVKIFPT